MRIKVLITFLFIIAAPTNHAQTFRISGTVRDSLTHETLIGAAVFNETESRGVVTSDSGRFLFTASDGNCRVRISYVGYRTKTITLKTASDTVLDLFLIPENTTSGEVVITAEKPVQFAENTRTGFLRLTAADLTDIPLLMGEPDLIRALNYSPGVRTSGDGNSGFYVRGGNVDQNLIMMDNALVYNPSHVLGFFSVFNSDIVSNATLIKSGIPANYGGRLSSVLAVKTIDGDFVKHHVSATAGLLYSKIAVNGPVFRNRLSYLVSLRKTYINEVVRPLIGLFGNSDSSGVLDGSRFGMYDFNAKLSAKLNQRNRVSLMYYEGRDKFSLNRGDIDFKTNINWGNSLLALNWNCVLNDSAYILNSLNYSKYDFNYDASQFIMDFDLFSSVRNYNYRFEYNQDNLRFGSFKIGAEARYYNFMPNRFMLTLNSTELNYSSYQDLHAAELAAFISFEKDLTGRLKISAGARFGNYRHLGPYDMVNRADGVVTDTASYKNMETIKSYSGIEPRISLRYQTSDFSSVKASYTRNYQYIHIASASSVTLPSDLWIPSTASTAPQYGDQFTLGFYRNFDEGVYTASAELYYKSLQNQVELLYGLGASLQDVSFENSLTSGKGYATGMEFFLQKHTGLFTGSMAYALSYTERQFDKINYGKPFPAKYDRRHELNLTAAWKPGKRWEFSSAFIYSTGNAMTVPVQIFLFDADINTEYSATNAFRMPSYHRLDFSATYTLKKTGRSESSLNFSIMNVYNRANPFLIYFEIKGDILNEHSLEVTARQISIFPLLPSISWNFKF